MNLFFSFVIAVCLMACRVRCHASTSSAEEAPAKIAKANEIISAAAIAAHQSATAVHSRSTNNIMTAMGRVSAMKAKFGYFGNRNMDHFDISAHFSNSAEGDKSGESNQSKSRVEATLEAHNVGDLLVAEINKMASSYIPKETIIDHVKKHHFPDKQLTEVNDIVVSAIAMAGSPLAGTMTTKQSEHLNAINNRKVHDQLKRNFERTFDQ